MEDGSRREDVADWAHLLPFDQSRDLGRDIPRCSASIEDVVLRLDEGRESEIDDDWIQRVLPSQHDVLGLEIPMHDAPRVQVRHPPRQASHELSDLVVRESSLPAIDETVHLPSR